MFHKRINILSIKLEEAQLMKKLYTFIILTAIVFFTVMPQVSAAEHEFKDVKKDQEHAEGIYWLYSKGAIHGYDNETLFKPYDKLMRMQAAKIFANALDLELPDEEDVENHFTDIKAGDENASEIAAVYEAGILTGEKGKYKPYEEMTREQMATTLVRAMDLQSPGEHVDISLKGVDESHQESVQIFADLDLTTELDDFRPAKSIQRDQFSALLYRVDQLIEEPNPEPEPDPEPKPDPDPEEDGSTKINKVTYDQDFNQMVKEQTQTPPIMSADGAWYNASADYAAYYLNSNNFVEGTDSFYQFLKLSGTSGVTAETLNSSVLSGKGMLDGEGDAFKKASKKHNVNDIYLISHAMLESGNGTSELASGVKVGKDKKGKPKRVTKKNKNKLTDIKKTYNMFGIGAVDSDPLNGGSERAYKHGWFSPEKAIIGGAKFISEDYISAGQDTLYKMKWNPGGVTWHQYATDVGWPVKQTKRIREIFDQYKDVDGFVLEFEVPVFKNQPAQSQRPTGIDKFHIDTKDKAVGKKAVVNGNNVNLREGPTTEFPAVTQLSKKKKVEILAKNTNWYKVKAGKKEGWILGKYIDIGNKKKKDK